MGKRAAAAPAGKAQTKAAKPTEPTGLEKLTALLSSSKELNPSSRKLLVSALPHALSTACSDRHHYQTQILGIVEKILSEGETQRKEAVTAAEAAQSELETKKSDAVRGMDEAKERAASSLIVKDSKEKSVVDAEAALEAQRKTLAEKEAAVSSLEGDKKGTSDELATHQSMMEDLWPALKDSTLDGKHWRERNKKISQIVAQLEKCDIPSSLGLALSATLKTKADARGSFAGKALAAAEEAFAEYLQKLQSKLDGFDGEKAKCTAEASEARAQVAEAVAALASAQEDSMNAQNKWAELESAVVQLKHSISQCDKEVQTLLESTETAKSELASYSEIVSGFATLRDGEPAAGSEAVPNEE